MSTSMDPQLLDERLRLTLRDMCRLCGVHAEFLMELVDEGIIVPAPTASTGSTRTVTRRRSRKPSPPQHWQFDGIAVVRVQRAVRLQRDLGVNLAGVALALTLLDEIEVLRQRP